MTLLGYAVTGLNQPVHARTPSTWIRQKREEARTVAGSDGSAS